MNFSTIMLYWKLDLKHPLFFFPTCWLVIEQPLDFESYPTHKLQIDARNPEPLMPGLTYSSESTAFVSVSVTDVDEVPEFNMEITEITVPENTTKGSVLLKVEARDPEGKEIGWATALVAVLWFSQSSF